MYPSTQDIHSTYIRCSYDIQDAIWISHVCTIYVLYPGGRAATVLNGFLQNTWFCRLLKTPQKSCFWKYNSLPLLYQIKFLNTPQLYLLRICTQLLNLMILSFRWTMHYQISKFQNGISNRTSAMYSPMCLRWDKIVSNNKCLFPWKNFCRYLKIYHFAKKKYI